MAQDLFRVDLGVSIEDALTEAHIIHGNGVPGGDAALQDAAPIGSIYLRTDTETNNQQLYWKYRSTQNSAADWEQSVSQSVLNAAINGLSWREPSKVIDSTTYADITAAETAANAGDTVDGVTIVAGDRILFADLTTGNDNVYVVGGTSGAWTFTEDSNTATDGDTVLVQEGTNAEGQYTFDGTDWVQTGGSTNANELAFIRSFIGKNSTGSETPVYTSATVVTQNGSLEAAIGELDVAVGDANFTEDNFVVDGDSLAVSIDNLDIQLGSGTHTSTNVVLNANDVTENFSALDVSIGDRNYTNTSNHILNLDGESITDSLEKLNTEIGSRNLANGYNLTNGDTITDSLDKIDIALGDPNHSSTNIISNAADINTNLSSLDQAIGNRTYTNDNVVTDGERVTASIDALDSQLGNNTYTESNVVSSGNNITENLNSLDIAVGNNTAQNLVIKTANVSAQTVVDSLALGNADVAKWILSFEDTTDSAHRQSLEIHAMHNGTVAKFDKYSIRRMGAKFTGLDIDVDVNAGSIRLLLTSTIPVDVAVKRVGFYTIN